MSRWVLLTIFGVISVGMTGCGTSNYATQDEAEAGVQPSTSYVYPNTPSNTASSEQAQVAEMSREEMDAYAAAGLPLNCDGQPLQRCTVDETKVTGFERTGYCKTRPDDYGTHVVCAEVTREFLDYTGQMGNDLETPRPEYRFPGLVPGDRWCLCAVRWREALLAGKAPAVVMNSTDDKALDYMSYGTLNEYAV